MYRTWKCNCDAMLKYIWTWIRIRKKCRIMKTTDLSGCIEGRQFFKIKFIFRDYVVMKRAAWTSHIDCRARFNLGHISKYRKSVFTT